MRRFRFFLCLLLLHLVAEAKPFVTSEVRYELGNQMFQIAAALAFAKEHDFEAYFPDLEKCWAWDIPENRRHVFWRLSSHMPEGEVECVYKEPETERPIPLQPNIKLVGYFQSESYFAHQKEEIFRWFAPSSDILDYLLLKYEEILAHPCTVAIHVRTFLKDYGHIPTNEELHAFVGIDYYTRAVALFPKEALFVVCSDSINWCKENLSHLAAHMVFIEGNKPYHDLYFMSLCKHNIIANSTFSWWAAYLNQNPAKKVITPDKWCGKWWANHSKNFLPKEWIRVPVGGKFRETYE